MICRKTARRAAMAVGPMVAALVSGSAAHGVTYTWVGAGGSVTSPASGSWSAGGNWVDGAVPVPGQATGLRFAGSAVAYTSTNDVTPAPFVLNRILLSSSSQATVNTIDGAALEFVTDRSVQANPPSIAPTSGSFLINNDLILDDQLRVGGKPGFITLAGVISGPGSLVANTAASVANLVITNTNTYTGGTTATGPLTVTGAGTLGTGAVVVSMRGGLFADAASNVASGAAGSVTIQSGGYAQFGTLDAAALGTINATSAGVVGVAADFAGPLDFSALPLLRLGGNAANVTISSAITPGGNTYRFGGEFAPTSTNALQANRLNVASLLTDDGGTARSVDLGTGGLGVGQRVSLTNPANSYSGGTVLRKASAVTSTNFLYFDRAPAAGETPLGTGPVTVYDTVLFGGATGGVGALPNAFVLKPGGRVYFDNSGVSAPVDRWPDAKPMALDSSTLEFHGSAAGATAEAIGVLSAGGASTAIVSRGAAGVTSEVRVASLARAGRGTLAVKTAQSDALGTDNLFKVADASNVVDPATGMLSPWVMGITDGFSTYPVGEFLRLRASDNAVVPVAYATAFDPARADEIVAFDASHVGEVSGNESVWAMKAQVNGYVPQTVHVPAGSSLTIGSGGLTLNGCTIYGGGTIRFGTVAAPAEGIVYVGQNAATIATPLAGTQGLTKTGPISLTLSADNAQLTGPITVNQGTLLVGNANALNGNPLTVSDLGTVDLNGFDTAVSSLSGGGTVTNKKNGWTAGQVLAVNQSGDTTFAGTLTDTPGLGVLAVTKAGAGTLTLSGTVAYSGLTTVSGGTLVVSPAAANTFGANTAYVTAAGTHLAFGGPRNVGTVTGEGDVSVDGALVTVTSVQQPSVSLSGGATLRLRSSLGDPTTSSIGVLSVAAGSTLDLTRNTLVLTGTPVGTVRQYLLDGRLSTSTPDPTDVLALGYIVGVGGVTVEQTYAGDANLDGRVDADDYALLDRGYLRGGSNWVDGDFNYDGAVTPADYLVIDRTAVMQGAPLSAGLLAQRESQFGSTYVSALVASVPEPGVGLAAIMGLAAVAARRRRRRALR